MKLRNLFFASLAMVTFAACSNDDEPILNNEPKDASIIMEIISKTNDQTKATTTENGGVTTVNESKINDLKLYVYSGENYFAELTIVSNGTVNSAAGVSQTSSSEPKYSFTLAGLKTQTAYTLVAIANPHFSGTVNPVTTTLTNLLAASQLYDDQFTGTGEAANKGSFTMLGLTNIADNTLTAEGPNTASINISRRLGGVQINKITMALPDDAGENFKDATVTLNGIALISVRATTQTGTTTQDEYGVDADLENTTADLISGNIWSTKEDNVVNANLYRTYTQGVNLGDAQAGTGYDPQNPGDKDDPSVTIGSASTPNRIYAFPTTNTGLTLKLKLTYTYNSVSTIRYYNIKLTDNKILNNTIYGIEATITGVGSKDPDVVEETAGDIITTLNVLPWKVAEVQNVEDLKD